MAKYKKLLDIRKVETKQGPKAKIQFGQGVEIFIDGKKLDLGEYNSVFLTTKGEREERLSYLVEQGIFKQENADREVDFMTKKNVSSLVEVKVED